MENQYARQVRAILTEVLNLHTVQVRSAGFLNESLLQGEMPSKTLQQALAELLARRPQTAEERLAIDGAIASLVRVMQSGDVLQVTGAAIASAIADQPPKQLSTKSPYYGLGLREAGPKRLSMLPPKTAQSARQIWEALAAEGYQSAHRDPVHAMNDALRRRAKTHADVLLVGEGKWGLKSWYSEDDLEEIKKSMGGMGGRDKASHSEATTRGMLVAMARGAKPGQPRKVTAENVGRIEEMIRSGMPISEVASQIGVTAGTIYNHFPSDKVRALRDEGRKQREKEAVSERIRH
jgi:hypothetical protein